MMVGIWGLVQDTVFFPVTVSTCHWPLHYLRQGGYVIVVVCLFVCLFVRNFVQKNFGTDLHEIFREGWQWAVEQLTKFWW